MTTTKTLTRARMADFPVDILKHDVLEFLQRSKASDYMSQVDDLVNTFEGRTLALRNPANVQWRICGLQDTRYSDRRDVMEGWGIFYLPDEVRMQVVGVVKGTSSPCEELVLMTCEDGKLYAYDEEELHVVASSLEQLCTEGLQYPSSLHYYKGETFSCMTYEEWEKVKQGALGRSLDKAHNELVTANKKRFLKHLRFRAKPDRKYFEKITKAAHSMEQTSLGLLDEEASDALTPPLTPPMKQQLGHAV